MSSDSEYDENAVSDQQSESKENGNEVKEETTTTSNGDSNGNNSENATATWNDLVSLEVIRTLLPNRRIFSYKKLISFQFIFQGFG